MLPTWRCPNLLFMLPPNAVWIANKVGAVSWPPRLNVHVLSESMTGASSVWNAMLGMWNHLKTQPGGEAAARRPATAAAETAAGPAAEAASPNWPLSAPSSAADLAAGPRPAIGAAPAQTALAAMLALDGLLGCAVVDATTGLVLAQESRGEQADMSLAAAACAQALRVHRQLARSMGLAEPIDEMITSAGSRQQIVRGISHRPELFLVALLDKQRTNLALARFQLADVERGLT
jgi:hypothetical protein